MQRVVDCGHMRTPICNSDHTGIKLVFRTGKLKQRSPRQELLAQHDHAELETEEGRKAYNDKCSASTSETIANGGTCIEAIHTACAKAAAALPRKTNDPNANWFSIHNDSMNAAIGKRNTAKKNHEQAPSTASRAKLRRARQNVEDQTARSKGAWVQHQALGIQRINRGTSHAWECCKRICAGVDGQLASRAGVTMRKPNGEVSDGSDEANAQCRGAYLEELFTKQITDMIPQLPTNYDLGICPPDGEMHWAVQKLEAKAHQRRHQWGMRARPAVHDERSTHCTMHHRHGASCVVHRRPHR
jgi:hypothetical protein